MPAAIFSHKECLVYTNPLDNISLRVIGRVVVLFGYAIWGFLFLLMPLAALGSTFLLISKTFAYLLRFLGWLLKLCRVREVGDSLAQSGLALDRLIESCWSGVLYQGSNNSGELSARTQPLNGNTRPEGG